MEIDRIKLKKILGSVADSAVDPDELFDDLNEYIEQVRMLALKWMHADCCYLLDRGCDPRQMSMPSIVNNAPARLTPKDLDGHTEALLATMSFWDRFKT